MVIACIRMGEIMESIILVIITAIVVLVVDTLIGNPLKFLFGAERIEAHILNNKKHNITHNENRQVVMNYLNSVSSATLPQIQQVCLKHCKKATNEDVDDLLLLMKSKRRITCIEFDGCTMFTRMWISLEKTK